MTHYMEDDIRAAVSKNVNAVLDGRTRFSDRVSQKDCVSLINVKGEGNYTINESTLSKYLKKRITPSAEFLFAFSKTFGVSVDWLLGISPMPSLDVELKAAAEYIGVQEETAQAVKNLFTFKADLRPFHLPIREEVQPFIEAIIQSDNFRNVIDGYVEYINHFIELYSAYIMDDTMRSYLENTPREAFSMITVSAYKAAEDIQDKIREHSKPPEEPSKHGKRRKPKKN